MSDKLKKDTEKKEMDMDECRKPNNPEAQRPNDEDDVCHEAVDGK
ncbi:MAG: hypothetical protein PF637_05340 [Spirochaetes bacterium]|jgi:hypothetical protein|nr:hypothetical protein [Spirochaetota bacterium]